MTLDEIEALIRMAGEAGLARLDIEDGDFALRIRATPNGIAVAAPTGAPTQSADAVRAALSGAFYVAPAPGQPPFVQVGDSFAAGDTLAILEAMKTLTNVVAPAAGRVLACHVADGAMVDADQPLFDVAWAE